MLAVEHAAQAVEQAAALGAAARSAATAWLTSTALLAAAALFATTAWLATVVAATQTENGTGATGIAEHQGDTKRRNGKNTFHGEGLLHNGGNCWRVVSGAGGGKRSEMEGRVAPSSDLGPLTFTGRGHDALLRRELLSSRLRKPQYIGPRNSC